MKRLCSNLVLLLQLKNKLLKQQWQQKNISINQNLCKSIWNSNPSLNNNIFITLYNSGQNLASADASKLHVLGPVGLMLFMSQNSWNMGKVDTVDSGFSVSKGIFALREKGSVWNALINRRGKGWPLLVAGKYIDKYFSNKQICYYVILEQVVNEVKFLFIIRKKKTI